jgi:hypothetical protein
MFPASSIFGLNEHIPVSFLLAFLVCCAVISFGMDCLQVDYADTPGRGFDEDGFDIVMANPPFTGSINKGNINKNLNLCGS